MNESVCVDVPGEIKKRAELIKLDKLDQYGSGLTESIIQWFKIYLLNLFFK